MFLKPSFPKQGGKVPNLEERLGFTGRGKLRTPKGEPQLGTDASIPFKNAPRPTDVSTDKVAFCDCSVRW